MSKHAELIGDLRSVGCLVPVADLAADALEAQAREIEGLRKDAERYLWLRENWFTMSSNYQQCITFKTGEPRWSNITEKELDAAIDTAKGAPNG